LRFRVGLDRSPDPTDRVLKIIAAASKIPLFFTAS
jgi:hypothetical protein